MFYSVCSLQIPGLQRLLNPRRKFCNFSQFYPDALKGSYVLSPFYYYLPVPKGQYVHVAVSLECIPKDQHTYIDNHNWATKITVDDKQMCTSELSSVYICPSLSDIRGRESGDEKKRLDK